MVVIIKHSNEAYPKKDRLLFLLSKGDDYLGIRKDLADLGIIPKEIQADKELLRFNKLSSFVEFTEEFKDILDDGTAYSIYSIIRHMCDRLSEADNFTEEFKKDLIKYLGETIAEEFLTTYKSLMRIAYDSRSVYDDTVSNDLASIVMDIPLQAGELYAMIIMFMYSFREENLGQRDVYFDMTNYTRLYDSRMSFAGKLLNLDEETKKNIIGSLWNCIIDIVSIDTVNIELKGGE